MKNKIILTALASSFFTIVLVGVVFLSLGALSRTKLLTLFAQQGNKHVPLTAGESLVIDAVKKTNPAVVSIVITKDVPKFETYYEQQPAPGLFGFGDVFLNIPHMRQNGTQEQKIGGGSGFFVTSSGYLITNKHVVQDTSAEYTVFTNDGKKYPAKVIARDQTLDVAILKVEGIFPYLEFGDSNGLQVGQSVIAIGNALGEFSNTVSVGVVSGLSRSITAGDNMGSFEQLDQVIQTDAAINPGNSGGPLLDLNGRVIGVNVAVAEGSENIGFALPGNAVKSIVDSVKATGTIVRPFIGIRYTQINADSKQKRNLPFEYGVLVEGNQTGPGVVPNSPADKAGIVESDIILEIDGVKLTAEHSLAALIREKKVGDICTLSVYTKGSIKTIPVKLEAAK